jgi:hypothetical protein
LACLLPQTGDSILTISNQARYPKSNAKFDLQRRIAMKSRVAATMDIVEAGSSIGA